MIEDGIEGFIVPIRNQDAIAEKIRLLYDNKALQRKLSENAHRKASQFSWNSYGEKLAAFIHSIG